MDFAFGEPQTVGEFLLVAAFEILLLSFGILLALRINNWNEARKESRQTDELLGLLIQDLRENLDEIVTDIGIGEGFIGMCETVIQQKDAIDQVEAEDIDNLLDYLAADHFFFAQSPAFTRLETSNIWEKLSDELNSKIHHIYYGRIGIIRMTLADAERPDSIGIIAATFPSAQPFMRSDVLGARNSLILELALKEHGDSFCVALADRREMPSRCNDPPTNIIIWHVGLRNHGRGLLAGRFQRRLHHVLCGLLAHFGCVEPGFIRVLDAYRADPSAEKIELRWLITEFDVRQRCIQNPHFNVRVIYYIMSLQLFFLYILTPTFYAKSAWTSRLSHGSARMGCTRCRCFALWASLL